MSAQPKQPARRKGIEREVEALERRLGPEQRESYVRHLLMCQLHNIVVTAETRLEWLKELEVK